LFFFFPVLFVSCSLYVSRVPRSGLSPGHFPFFKRFFLGCHLEGQCNTPPLFFPPSPGVFFSPLDQGAESFLRGLYRAPPFFPIPPFSNIPSFVPSEKDDTDMGTLPLRIVVFQLPGGQGMGDTQGRL